MIPRYDVELNGLGSALLFPIRNEQIPSELSHSAEDRDRRSPCNGCRVIRAQSVFKQPVPRAARVAREPLKLPQLRDVGSPAAWRNAVSLKRESPVAC